MYCVKCGVKLQDGARSCPLCDTPVLYSENLTEKNTPSRYSDRYPDEDRHALLVSLGLITALMIAAAMICLTICIKTFGSVSWSGYVMAGIALAWVILILPFWFKKSSPLIFVPIDIGAVCLFLLFVCLYNKQHWFISFGLPVTLLIGAFGLVAYILFHYIKKGKLYIFGGLVIAAGAVCLLIEFFQHITFGSEMFLWSLYCVGVCTAIGLFFIIAAIIPPLASYLERRFFI
ncbi:MAG: hypothetical protein IJL87_04845 [Clostridia bacterium]|nr:hypothetical protein [Clostridia bacterium]